MGPPGDPAATYANLGVQLAGSGGRVVRWSVGPVEQAPSGRLTLVGGEGKATLEFNTPGEPYQLELIRGGQREVVPYAAWSPPSLALEQLERALAGEPASPTWPDGCRDIELTESIARSLAKGRTIELHNEEHSEHGTFKGTMTSLGCGLLWLSLVVFVIALVLAWLTGAEVFRYAPHFILGVLALFLAVQSLKLVFRDDE
jgi:myo-inositol 2-dehydrogenase/D-chiro-inositol 1-dehydrogenase